MFRYLSLLSIFAIAGSAFGQDTPPPRHMASSNAYSQVQAGKRVVIADFNILGTRGHTGAGTIVLGLANGSFDSCKNVQIHVRDLVSAEPGKLAVYKDGKKVRIQRSTMHDTIAAFDIEVPIMVNESVALQVTVDTEEPLMVDYGKIIGARSK